jgi:hypothetical protein
MTNRYFLYDDKEDTKTRFVSFIWDTQRFDLAITYSRRFYGKQLVLDLQGSRYAIIGPDDLEEASYLENAFQISPEDAEELRSFLVETL